jgi:hypothetical protein
MHEARRTDDRVDRARLNALGAADALGFIDPSYDGLIAMHSELRIHRLRNSVE